MGPDMPSAPVQYAVDGKYLTPVGGQTFVVGKVEGWSITSPA